MQASYCTSCGAKRLPDARFCGECGLSLEAFGMTAPWTPVPGSIAAPAPQPIIEPAPRSNVPVVLIILAVVGIAGLAIWQWPTLTGALSGSGQGVFGDEWVAPAEPRIVAIDPASWDPAASSWNEGGPAYESSPGIVAFGATHTHAFGSAVGALTYAFDLDGGTSGIATITARLSSEHGMYSAPADWVSDVTLLVNGNPVGTVQVIPDDGSGQPYTWGFDASLLRSGTNSLSFGVSANAANRHGLCIYGRSLVADQPDSLIELMVP